MLKSNKVNALSKWKGAKIHSDAAPTLLLSHTRMNTSLVKPKKIN